MRVNFHCYKTKRYVNYHISVDQTSLLSRPRGQHLYCIEGLHPQRHPTTPAVLRDAIKGTLGNIRCRVDGRFRTVTIAAQAATNSDCSPSAHPAKRERCLVFLLIRNV